MFKQILAAVALATKINAAGVVFDYKCGASCDNINDIWAQTHDLCKVTPSGEQSPIDLVGGEVGGWDLDIDIKNEKYTNQNEISWSKSANGVVGSLDAGEMKLWFNDG